MSSVTERQRPAPFRTTWIPGFEKQVPSSHDTVRLKGGECGGKPLYCTQKVTFMGFELYILRRLRD